MVKILCLNTWGGRVFSELRPFIEQADADILCLQEVNSVPVGTPATDFWFPLQFRKPEERLERMGLFRELCRLLPSHHPFFFPAWRGMYAGDFGATCAVQWGLATFIHSRLAVSETSTHFLFGDFDAEGDPSRPPPANAQCFCIWDYETTQPFWLINLHGMWSTQGKEDTPERALQSVRLVELIQRIPSDRFVICGDFNLLPTSETFVRLRALGFRNLLVDHGITSTRTSLYTKSGSYADYVLVSERMRVHSFVVPAAPEVSDHRPLILECE